MKRRRFVRTLALGSAALGMPDYRLWAKPPLKQGERPNVLFIASDDLNDWIGCLGGHPDAKTPNIDRLARRGVIFEQAHCQAPICNPSRTSLFTGLRPSTTGVYGNRQPFRFSEVGRGAVTLPEYFKDNGYYTTGSGKMFHGKFPDPESWETYSPGLFNQVHPQIFPPVMPWNGLEDVDGIDWAPLDAPDEDMQDYKTADYCIGQLQKEHDRPFFLACGFKLPHLDWYVPRKYFELYDPQKVTLPKTLEGDLDDIPAIGRSFASPEVARRIREAGLWGQGVAAYLGCIAFVDMLVGRVLDALDASPYADNTIIVFWGDHGWHLGEKEHWKKSTLWEEGTRTTLMMSAPGVVPPDSRCARTVGLIDLYPTLVELCGLPPKDGLEGVSLMPLLKNPTTPWDRPVVTTHERGNHSVRSEAWRYTRYRDGTEELYDHRKDPMEWKNLADDPEFKEIKAELARWVPQHNEPDSEVVKWPKDEESYRARIRAIMREKGR